ncbi:DNA adenine methylase [Sphingomonas sp. R647]|uniref:DNA adenine methylase n=1 Tax=Sphingomonas sp. R647 TaxID=2875233 RepID=UPI001CD58054|nr:DNA adenine methylase [Sphingomonas sp. R647]MCA1199120.1 DNA adenine methylase [Sphingomonas sp. R647]
MDTYAMNPSSTPVSPVRPAAGYIGGKRNLARKIVPMIDATEHALYGEPFVGMGGIFLRRRRRPSVEAINDASGDVATLFRVLQEHYPYLIDMLRWRVASRAEFDRLIGMDPTRLTDLQRAARFLYVQKLGFGGKVAGRHFGISPGQSARFDVSKLEPLLADIHERLCGVWIEQLDFATFIGRYDRADALFYLDPPYWGSEDDYGAELFGRHDFDRLAGALRGVRGKFLLSINDCPGVRQCFDGFQMAEVQTTYTVGGMKSGGVRAGELLISNYALPTGG